MNEQTVYKVRSVAVDPSDATGYPRTTGFLSRVYVCKCAEERATHYRTLSGTLRCSTCLAPVSPRQKWEWDGGNSSCGFCNVPTGGFVFESLSAARKAMRTSVVRWVIRFNQRAPHYRVEIIKCEQIEHVFSDSRRWCDRAVFVTWPEPPVLDRLAAI